MVDVLDEVDDVATVPAVVEEEPDVSVTSPAGPHPEAGRTTASMSSIAASSAGVRLRVIPARSPGRPGLSVNPEHLPPLLGRRVSEGYTGESATSITPT